MHSRYFFDDYILDKGNSLCKNGQYIKIPPKEMKLLELLLNRAGEIITKDDIIEKVWCGGIVSDESLTRCVYNLRKILSKNKMIETLYGKGFRFVGHVSNDAAAEPITIRTAIFPYQMANKTYSLELNDQIIDMIHLNFFHEYENYVLASLAFTQMAREYSEILNAVQIGEIDFYITGTEMNYEGGKSVRLELTRGVDHGVIKRVVLPLHQRVEDDLICHSNEIVNMLSFINNGSDYTQRESHHCNRLGR